MGRVVNVNWVELHQIGDKFLDQANEIHNIELELKELFESVDNAWRGYDADNYKKNCKKLVKNLNIESYYLSIWYGYLNKTSSKYVGNIEDGLLSLQSIEALYNDEENK